MAVSVVLKLDVHEFGVEANADKVGGTAAAVVGTAIASHIAISAVKRAQNKGDTK